MEQVKEKVERKKRKNPKTLTKKVRERERKKREGFNRVFFGSFFERL